MRGDADADLDLLQRFLVAQVDAEKVLGWGECKPFSAGFTCSKCLATSSTKCSWSRLPAALTIKIAGSEVVSIEAGDDGALEFLDCFAVPRIGRPREWFFQKLWVKISWTR